MLAWKGHRIKLFSLVLNTAVRVGSDPVKLAARLHGQCELHCWVDGKDRAWLAGIIARGLEDGVFRDVSAVTGSRGGPLVEKGTWESVMQLLISRDDEPVVTSYSVCESFLSSVYYDWEPAAYIKPDYISDDDWREMDTEQCVEYGKQGAWDQVPDVEKWRIGMEWLKSQHDGLQITPDNWDSFSFGHELSALDLLAPDYQERLDTAFKENSDTSPA